MYYAYYGAYTVYYTISSVYYAVQLYDHYSCKYNSSLKAVQTVVKLINPRH